MSRRQLTGKTHKFSFSHGKAHSKFPLSSAIFQSELFIGLWKVARREQGRAYGTSLSPEKQKCLMLCDLPYRYVFHVRYMRYWSPRSPHFCDRRSQHHLGGFDASNRRTRQGRSEVQPEVSWENRRTTWAEPQLEPLGVPNCFTMVLPWKDYPVSKIPTSEGVRAHHIQTTSLKVLY